MDSSEVAVLILLGLVALRAVLIGLGAALILRPVRACPACFRPTFLLERRWLRRLVPWLQWRWCPYCGWTGPSKRTPGPSARAAGGPGPVSAGAFRELDEPGP